VTRLALTAALVALALAGCGGGSTATTATTGATTAVAPQPKLHAEPGAGRALHDFVEAAARNDLAGMYALMTRRAQVLYGPTEAAFAKGVGRQLATILGAFRRHGVYQVAFAARVTPDWTLVAVSGYVLSKQKRSYGAYAVPARREGGRWKLEFGGTVSFNPLSPDEQLKTDSTPQVATELTASEPILEKGIWIDRTEIAADLSPDGLLLTGEVTTPIKSGRHVAITFAATESSAGANAFAFESG
jgi:hypothetical protein